jgi:hypothetical protein
VTIGLAQQRVAMLLSDRFGGVAEHRSFLLVRPAM